MKIVIAGAGDIGFHLAKLLSVEEHDIVMIDIDPVKLKYVNDHLDVAIIKGASSSYQTLESARIHNADLLIATTDSQENNILTAAIGKRLGAKKTVARISNSEFFFDKKKLDLKELGVDEVISPASLAAREIRRLLKLSAITDTFDFAGGRLTMIGISIDEKDPLNNRTLNETMHLNPDLDFLTVAILRNNKTIIPRGSTRFQINDHVYYIALPSGVERVLQLTGKQNREIKNIMILGGSNVGQHAATLLAEKYKIKLVEQDKEKCMGLCDQLRNTLIINGDGRDVELLEEENIDQMDAFIAVTGDSETNIISSLVAKNHKVKRTIALVENMDYIHLSQSIGVDTLINKKLIAANFIFRYIREGNIHSITSIHGVDAEILEFEVAKGSKVVGKPLRKLGFPRSAIIGGVIRDDKGYIPMGDFVFQEHDRIVVLSKYETIHAVESFFK